MCHDGPKQEAYGPHGPGGYNDNDIVIVTKPHEPPHPKDDRFLYVDASLDKSKNMLKTSLTLALEWLIHQDYERFIISCADWYDPDYRKQNNFVNNILLAYPHVDMVPHPIKGASSHV